MVFRSIFSSRSALWAAGCLAAVVFCAAAQTAPPPAATGNSTVIFSRSTDESGKATTQAAAALASPAIAAVGNSAATDAERQALRCTRLDLELHLHPADEQIAVRVRITLRNDSKSALAHIPLQISSSLNWERIRLQEPSGLFEESGFQTATLNSDADHTGQLHEAVLTLAQPLAAGALLHLDASYSGTIQATAARLLAIGTPDDVALHSDWDRITVPFTGLRGFGNVVWYPVSSVPVLLGDGARLFDQIGEQKLKLAGAAFRLHLVVEYPQGQAPTVALINGQAVPLAITEAAAQDSERAVEGVATGSLEGASLGAPSLFVALRNRHASPSFTAWTQSEDDLSQPSWGGAAARVAPFLEQWLGPHSGAPLVLLDLPEAQDAPFEAGALLAAPLGDASPEKIDSLLVHALTHAWRQSPHPQPEWLDEGVAHFLSTVWIEKQAGREKALQALESLRPALALVEPESPATGLDQPLDAAIAPIYYSAKAGYIFWMLRDLIGDRALASVFESSPAGTASSAAFEKLIQKNASGRDLSWFFADWIDADKGLPDLSIKGVYQATASGDNHLVAVSVSNLGNAAAEVAVTVRSAEHAATERLLVPARGSAVQRILIAGKPIEVQVNDGTVPETGASVHLTRLDAPAAAGSSSSQPEQAPQ